MICCPRCILSSCLTKLVDPNGVEDLHIASGDIGWFLRLAKREAIMLLRGRWFVRARYSFHVDVRNVSTARVEQFLRRVKRDLKKKKFVNSSGRLDMRYNPLANDEDINIPIRACYCQQCC